MKNNQFLAKLYPVYVAGFLVILALPLLVAPPWFFPVDWGKTVAFRSILAVLAFLFAWQLLFKKDHISLPDIKNNKIIWALGLLGVAIFLSVLFSVDKNFSLWGSPYRAGGAINLLFYGFFSVFAFLTIKKSDWRKFLDFSIFVGVLVCGLALVQFYSLFSNVFVAIDGRPPSTMGNPILLGIYLLLLFFITLSFAVKETKKSPRAYYYYGVLALFLCVILITGSRAAYLGLLAGSLYFLLWYPKKLFHIKLAAAIIVVLGIFSIYYVNTTTQFPTFLKNNKIFQTIRPRLSLTSALSDPRFSAWKVSVQAIKEKPIFGWGPENFSVGFDKHYDPSLPYISKEWGGWWDRPHNVLLDIATSSGIPAAIFYIALLITLFWQLQRVKKPKNPEPEIHTKTLDAHGLQSTFIAYLVANLFSFDGFSSYLVFSLLIGYAIYLTASHSANTPAAPLQHPAKAWKKIIIALLTLILVVFLWNYSAKPFFINAKIEKADALSKSKKCDQALAVMEKTLLSHSFLDTYARIKYIEYLKRCAEFFPGKNASYADIGLAKMTEAVKTRPQYSRLWIYMGSFVAIKANVEQKPDIKQSLISEAYTYFEKAAQLAPKHQEVLLEQAKTDMIAKDYQSMKNRALDCIKLDPNLNDCYWTKAVAEVYLKNYSEAKEDIATATSKNLGSPITSYLYLLANAYTATGQYTSVVAMYRQLVELYPNNAQYRASLAYAYYETRDYKNARKEALKFIELMPEAKAEGEAFLKLLPY